MYSKDIGFKAALEEAHQGNSEEGVPFGACLQGWYLLVARFLAADTICAYKRPVLRYTCYVAVNWLHRTLFTTEAHSDLE